MAANSFEAGKLIQKKKLVNPRDVRIEVKRVEFAPLAPKPRTAGIDPKNLHALEINDCGEKPRFFAMAYTVDKSNLLEKRNLRVGGYGSLRGAIRAVQKYGSVSGGVYDEHRQLVAAIWKGRDFVFHLPEHYKIWEQDSRVPELARFVAVNLDYWKYLNNRGV